MSDFGPVEILLIEDSDSDAEMILRALRKDGLHARTLRVRDGVEALEFLFRDRALGQAGGSHLKLILLDLKTPRLGGIDVLRRVKAHDQMRMIPTVILSSSAEERDIADSYRFGVNSYLVKPANFSRLSEMIAQAGVYWAVMNRVPPTTAREPGITCP